MLDYQGGKAFALAVSEMHGEPTDMTDEDFLVESQHYLDPQRDADAAVIELNDRRLHNCWRRFCSNADDYAYEYADAKEIEVKNQVYDTARASLSALLKRLNQLERRR